MSKVNYFGDMNVDAEDLDFTEYGKSDESRDSIKASMETFGVGIKDHDDTYLKVIFSSGDKVLVSPGYAIDALGRTIYLPQDRSAVGSTPGAPGYHPAWPDDSITRAEGYVCIEYNEEKGESEADDEGNAYYTRYYKSYSITLESNIDGMNTEANPKIPLAKITGSESIGYTLTDIRPILRFWSAGSDLDSHQKIEHCNGLIPSGSDSLIATKYDFLGGDYIAINQIETDDCLYLNGERLTEVIDSEWKPATWTLPPASGNYSLYYESSGSLGYESYVAALDYTQINKYYIATLTWEETNGDITNLVDRRVWYGMRDDMIRNTSDVSGSTVKDALNNIGMPVNYDDTYLRRDGTYPMTGNLDVDEHDVTNVQTLTGFGGLTISPGGILVVDNNISTSGNISLSSGKTVDGIDISEYQRGFDYVVEGNGEASKGTVSLSTALAAAVVSSKVSIFIKNGNYTLGNTYTLKENTTIIGENLNETVITFDGHALYFNNYFLVKNLKFSLDGEELEFYDYGILENCYFDVTPGSPSIYMGKSKFTNIYTTAAQVSDAAGADLYDSELMGCTLGNVTSYNNCKIIDSVFDKVTIKGYSSKFISSKAASVLIDGYKGWIISKLTYNQFTNFTNCEGDFDNQNNYVNQEDQPHVMVNGHKGNWYGLTGSTMMIYSVNNYYYFGSGKWHPWIY